MLVGQQTIACCVHFYCLSEGEKNSDKNRMNEEDLL